jgi:hypothetical protein
MKTKKGKFFRKILTGIILCSLLLSLLTFSPAKTYAKEGEGKVDFAKMHHFHISVFDPGDNNITGNVTDGEWGQANSSGEVALILFKGDANDLSNALCYIKISDHSNWFNLGRGITNKYNADGSSFYERLKKCNGGNDKVTQTLNGSLGDCGIDRLCNENSWEESKDSNGKYDGKEIHIKEKALQDNGEGAFVLEPQDPGIYTVRAFGTAGDMPFFPDKKGIFWKTRMVINANDPEKISIEGPAGAGMGDSSSSYIDPNKPEDQWKLMDNTNNCGEKNDEGNIIDCYHGQNHHEQNDDSGEPDHEPGGSLVLNVLSDPSGWNLWEALNPINLAIRIFITLINGLLELFLGLIRGMLLDLMKGMLGTLLKAPADLYSITPVVEGWQITRGVANVFFIIVFFLLLFLNLVGPYIDPYLIKKTLPRFVLAIIGVNLSLFICNELVKLANVISAYFLGSTQGGNIGNIFANVDNAWHEFSQAWSPSAGVGSLFASLLGKILEVIGLVFMLIVALILAFVFMIRVGIIMLLAVLAPFMFLSLAVPFAQAYVKSWWEKYIKWVFMGPIIALIIYLIWQMNISNFWDKVFK